MSTATVEPPEESLSHDAPVSHKQVYLWHWPVRGMHWIAAACIVTLIVTGFYIGRPYFYTSGSATDHFLMGRIRFIHFSAAAVLVATAILRTYWLFVGNRFERWRALLPVGKRSWINLSRVLKAYLFIEPEKAPRYLGHNPVQQLSYTLLYGVALTQLLTGFYMYGLSNPGGFFFILFGWIGPFLGGAQVARFVHHVLTWFWLIFLPLHVYLTIRGDVVHGESRVSSIVSGNRYVRADVDFVDD
ncbi:MAG TPA: Ni/Fe-hydrogenase, b-type cytochrome subunit [Longimicrobiales bacterium]|nr:Ni/Fe-hydrogenase, b-type cytochrome subunit [Longimicrobiales bacterium]